MTQSLVLTAIGDDRHGLVEKLASTISRHEGNWLESSMSRLSGKFAGIVRIEVPDEHVTRLSKALSDLPELRVLVETSGPEITSAAGARFSLQLVGHDRLGIVREVTTVLARHAVNVEKLVTGTASAPMSAEMLFKADAELLAAPGFDIAALQDDLERISADLMVDIDLVRSEN